MAFTLSGGTTTTPGDGYEYHVFNTTANLTVSGGTGVVEVLVVAGGGGGSSSGGGAGGVVYDSAHVLTTGVYSCTIGAGGAGQIPSNGQGATGADSVFNGITALGGAGGSMTNTVSVDGGSGGGGAQDGFSTLLVGGAATQGSSGGGTGYGNQGGSNGGISGGIDPSGGGGGAGSVGSDATSPDISGDGGAGIDFWDGSGALAYYGGGGGGADFAGSGTPGLGGIGGGGDGSITDGVDATANTGGGGGAAQGVSGTNTGGAGGSGIIIVRLSLADQDQFINIPPAAAGSGFSRFQVPHGTAPDATTSTTNTFTSVDNTVFIVGNSSTNTIDLHAVNQAALASEGDWSIPLPVSTTITLTPNLFRVQLFVVGDSGPVTATGIDNGSSSHELYIIGTDDTDTVTIPASLSNVVLNGDCTLGLAHTLSLQWVVGLNKWVEVARSNVVTA